MNFDLILHSKASCVSWKAQETFPVNILELSSDCPPLSCKKGLPIPLQSLEFCTEKHELAKEFIFQSLQDPMIGLESPPREVHNCSSRHKLPSRKKNPN